jgi:putative oxidoreductase
MAGLFGLIARILLAAMFLASSRSALSNIAGTAEYFAGLGLSPGTLFAWGVGLFELATGVLLVIGYQTRPVAAVLALFTLSASYLGHFGQGGDDPTAAFMHSQLLLKDIAVAGGLILLALHGAGRLSVDGWAVGSRQ